MKCHGRFKIQALTNCDAKVMSTRTAAGQFKGQFKGAMDNSSRKVQNANAHFIALRTHTKHSLSIQRGNG